MGTLGYGLWVKQCTFFLGSQCHQWQLLTWAVLKGTHLLCLHLLTQERELNFLNWRKFSNNKYPNLVCVCNNCQSAMATESYILLKSYHLVMWLGRAAQASDFFWFDLMSSSIFTKVLCFPFMTREITKQSAVKLPFFVHLLYFYLIMILL